MFGPAQFLTSDCGSLPVSTTAANNSRTAPGVFTVGEIVRGQLVPGTLENNFHIWRIELAAGNYHVVADAETLAEGTSSIGLRIDALGPTTDDDERIAFETESGYNIRVYDFLEVREARTLDIKLEAVYDSIHNYTIGVFANGTSVPSPTFENCAPINALGLDSTVSVTLEGSRERSDDLWYEINLNEQEYQLDASTRSADRQSLGFRFDLLKEFAQTDDAERITFATESGTELVSSDTFEVLQSGKSWIRLRNVYTTDSNVEFTVTAP